MQGAVGSYEACQNLTSRSGADSFSGFPARPIWGSGDYRLPMYRMSAGSEKRPRRYREVAVASDLLRVATALK